MITYMQQLVAGFQSESLIDGLLQMFVFFLVAVLVSWRNPYNLGFRFYVQLTCAQILARYLGSLLRYGEPLREGPWPILWSLASMIGIYIVWRKRGYH